MKTGDQQQLTADQYHAAPGLSTSGLCDLAISPLHYWFRSSMNPHRPPDEPTAQMMLGTALHVAVLEPESFDSRYCQMLDRGDYPGLLDTIDEMKSWLVQSGGTYRACTRKSEW